jgi:hypothetical protein
LRLPFGFNLWFSLSTGIALTDGNRSVRFRLAATASCALSNPSVSLPAGSIFQSWSYVYGPYRSFANSFVSFAFNMRYHLSLQFSSFQPYGFSYAREFLSTLHHTALCLRMPSDCSSFDRWPFARFDCRFKSAVRTLAHSLSISAVRAHADSFDVRTSCRQLTDTVYRGLVRSAFADSSTGCRFRASTDRFDGASLPIALAQQLWGS